MADTLEYSDQANSLRKLIGENDAFPTPEISHKSDRKGTRVITITSGKGGVGKSSFAVNFGLALVNAGEKVLLFDADLGLANINVLLGIVPKFNLYHVLKGHKTLQDIIIHSPEGLDIIPGASGQSNIANLKHDDREKLLNEFAKVHGYNILLIDTGAGIGLNVIDFTLPADDIIVLTTPEPTSITDAYGVIKSVVLVAPDKNIHIVVNRATSVLEGKKVSERIVKICNQFLNFNVKEFGFIYEDPDVPKSVRKQKPFYLLYPKGKASSCLNILVGKLLNKEPNTQKTFNGIGDFFKKALQIDRT